MSKIRKALSIDDDVSTGIVPTIEALIESNNDWRKTTDLTITSNNHLIQELAIADRRIKDLEKRLSDFEQNSPSTAQLALPLQYAVVGMADLFDDPQIAVEASVEDGYECGIVVEARQVGIVQIRPMYVPTVTLQTEPA